MENACASGCSGSINETRVCPEGVNYTRRFLESAPKKAIVACEGGCIKGEVARVAANLLAYRMHREEAVRICLGDAATGNSGFLALLKRAPEVIAIEGCPLQCGTEILKKRVPDLETRVVDASQLYQYDRSRCFEIFDLTREEIEGFAQQVANHACGRFFSGQKTETAEPCCSSGSCCG